jgi:serine/threonine protein phosphatase PrpC
VRKDLPNEDHAASGGRGSRAAVVVADGHGDPACPRAHVGARFAVGEAMLSMLDAHELLGEDQAENEELMRDRLFADILGAWRSRVLEDSTARPFSDDELAAIRPPSDESEESIRNAAIRAYGTTLVAAAVCPGWLLLLQVGDGECGVVYLDRPPIEPLPDDGVAGVRTTSMALPDAGDLVRVAALPLELDQVAAVWVCTDGFSTAQADPAWRELVGEQLREALTTMGPREVADQLPGWLGPAASAGGDDTTMAILLAGHLAPAGAAGTDGSEPLRPPRRPRVPRTTLWDADTDPATATLPGDGRA